jgi:archaemetzincin
MFGDMDLRIAIVPVGHMDPAEVEAAAVRVAKVLNKAVEVREPAPGPKAGHDAARGQHLSGPFLAELKAVLPRLKVAKLAGGAPSPAPVAAATPDVVVFVTDVDLYRPQTEGIFGEVDGPGRVAVVSVRRLREAFYRRKTDPARQRARLVKMILYAIGRVCGLPDCKDVHCAMSTMTALADVDMKPEKYCAACWRRLSTGAFRI